MIFEHMVNYVGYPLAVSIYFGLLLLYVIAWKFACVMVTATRQENERNELDFDLMISSVGQQFKNYELLKCTCRGVKCEYYDLIMNLRIESERH